MRPFRRPGTVSVQAPGAARPNTEVHPRGRPGSRRPAVAAPATRHHASVPARRKRHVRWRDSPRHANSHATAGGPPRARPQWTIAPGHSDRGRSPRAAPPASDAGPGSPTIVPVGRGMSPTAGPTADLAWHPTRLRTRFEQSPSAVGRPPRGSACRPGRPASPAGGGTGRIPADKA